MHQGLQLVGLRQAKRHISQPFSMAYLVYGLAQFIVWLRLWFGLFDQKLSLLINNVILRVQGLLKSIFRKHSFMVVIQIRLLLLQINFDFRFNLLVINKQMINEEKVQFFNSQSSFGSQSSLASSRYFDLTNQIVEETQNVILTLRKQFLPTKQLTNLDKIDYLLNRANIICNDTIPDHLQYLNKIQSPHHSKEMCNQCTEKLKKLIRDYESLKNGTMLHKQFYNIYGRSNENNLFFKKQKLGALESHNYMLQPDVVNIGQPRQSRTKHVQQYNLSSRGMASSNVNLKDKQVKQLQQQITRMRKRENDLKKQFDYLLTNEKINCQKRIRLFLISYDQKQATPEAYLEEVNNYKNQATLLHNQLEMTLTEKRQLLTKNDQLQSQIVSMVKFNQSLKDELSGYRKLQNSRMCEDQQLDRSFHSQYNAGDDGSKNTRKLTSLIKKLTQQRDILRNQLAKQRQSIHTEKMRSQQTQSKQILRLKHYLTQRNKQIEQHMREFDKIRVELIQMKQENKNLKKNISTVKENNEELKIKANQYNLNNDSISTNLDPRSDRNVNFIKKNNNQAYNGLQTSIINAAKPSSFEEYQGEGIEGYPYFELLPKQFKVRFKRACLKPKQLLYKAHGLQIGVISQFLPPNIVKVLVHITNSSESDIKNFKVKALNPNDNKVQYQVEEIKILSSNQQVKVPVTCTIKNYPIGPVVIVLDYLGQEKHDLRLLLPIHIFKCVEIQHREQKLFKPNKVTVKTERKMCKDLGILKQFLNCSEQQEIKVKIRHQHSNSLLYLNATMNKQDIQLEYQHISGMERFTEYFIKTFKTLLQKLN